MVSDFNVESVEKGIWYKVILVTFYSLPMVYGSKVWFGIQFKTYLDCCRLTNSSYGSK